MLNTIDQKIWNVAVLNIDWRADRHEESHCIEFERPTADNPHPQYPVVVGKVLSKSRLPMSGEWGQLFATIVVKAFDEHSLTVQYGDRKYVINPDRPWVKLGEGGMSYTSFWLYLGVKYVEPKPVMPPALTITHDEAFLRRFRVKGRIMRLTEDDVQLLRKGAATGNVYAQYGLGRWLYFMAPSDTSMIEAEELFRESMNDVPDALAAYALMWRYGETKENVMDIAKSNTLLQKALKCGSKRAAQQQARFRIFGLFCEAEPAAVAQEIEKRLDNDEDGDPYWHVLLAYAYEQTGRKDDAVGQYEQAIRRGELECYFDMAAIYRERGNMALYDSLMEEGISRGSASCCIYQADMLEEDFQGLTGNEQRQIHEKVANQLEKGLLMGNGLCAYYLWVNFYFGVLGFNEDKTKAVEYLKRGARLGEVNCLERIAMLHSDEEWSEQMSRTERYELWLRAARYLPDEKEALYRLKSCNDEAFLLHHKEELETYWQSQFKEVLGTSESPELEHTGIPKGINQPEEPMVIVIWPSGHMDLPAVDVAKMKSYREMAQELIGAEGLDAVHYSPLLQQIAEAAGLKQELVMYVDRDALTKDLPDNAIGTQLYGTGQEVRGPIIICQQDSSHDCHSFKTLHDIVSTYTQINNHCGGLLFVKDDDDGRYDAWT